MTITYDPRAMTAKERAYLRAIAARATRDDWSLGLGRACLNVGIVCAVLAWVLL